jgi:two-component sensor histidine kinase
MSNLFKQIQTVAVPGGSGTAASAPPQAANRKTRAQESEHRIKNHLQLIGSSLAIQARGAVHAEARELLMQAYGRISAIARLHARFQDLSELNEIQVSEFLGEVCADLSICFNATGAPPVQLELDIQQKAMQAADALTLGLIVNELVINAVKHGPRGGVQLVRIRFRQEGRNWRLTVHDNGPGVDPASFDVGASLGMRLLHALAAQIGGVLQIDPVNHGASISVVFG